VPIIMYVFAKDLFENLHKIQKMSYALSINCLLPVSRMMLSLYV